MRALVRLGGAFLETPTHVARTTAPLESGHVLVSLGHTGGRGSSRLPLACACLILGLRITEHKQELWPGPDSFRALSKPVPSSCTVVCS